MRPIKKPNLSALKQWGIVRLISDDVRAVLKNYSLPAHWDDNEILIIARWIVWDTSIDAVKIKRTKSDVNYDIPVTIRGKKLIVGVKLLEALHFAKMYAEASEQLIDALPKILKRIRARLKTKSGLVIFHEAANQDFARAANCDPDLTLWQIAKPTPKLSKLTRLDIQQKDVEHVRREIRNRFPNKG